VEILAYVLGASAALLGGIAGGAEEVRRRACGRTARLMLEHILTLASPALPARSLLKDDEGAGPINQLLRMEGGRPRENERQNSDHHITALRKTEDNI
jgi:hypothetical protein